MIQELSVCCSDHPWVSCMGQNQTPLPGSLDMSRMGSLKWPSHPNSLGPQACFPLSLQVVVLLYTLKPHLQVFSLFLFHKNYIPASSMLNL